MDFLARFSKAPRRLAALGLTIALAATTVAITQCRMVGSDVTGVKLDAPSSISDRAECIMGCTETFKEGLRAEKDRHRDAVEACGSDTDCREAENQIHSDNIEALADAMESCKSACYNEGSGSAGR